MIANEALVQFKDAHFDAYFQEKSSPQYFDPLLEKGAREVQLDIRVMKLEDESKRYMCLSTPKLTVTLSSLSRTSMN